MDSEQQQQQRPLNGSGTTVAYPHDLHLQQRIDGGYRDSRDFVSEDLQRKAILVVIVAALGIGVGIFALRVAGETGAAEWLGVATVGVAALALLFRKFSAGIVAYMGVAWIAIGTPAMATSGSGSGQGLRISQIGLVVLLLVWALRILIRQRIGLARTPINLPLALYLGICVWSTVNGILLPDALVAANVPEKQYLQVNILELAIRFLALGAIPMIACNLSGRELKAAAVVVILPGILSFTGLLPFIPTSTYLAFPQIIAMTILAALVLTKQGPLWLRLLAAAFALSIFGFYFVKGTEWVSGWMGALTALAVLTYQAQRRLFWASLILLGIVVIANYGYFYQAIYVSNFKTGTFSNDRVTMLSAAMQYAAKFPLGIGLGNYRSYNAYYGRSDVWNTSTFSSAHGSYAQALSETGWLGLFALLFLLAAGTRMLSRFYHALPPGWAKSYMLGALGSFVGIYVAGFNGDYLFPSYHNGGMGSFGACVYVFLLVGVAIAIAREKGLVFSGPENVATEPIPVGPIYNRPPLLAPSPTVTAASETTL